MDKVFPLVFLILIYFSIQFGPQIVYADTESIQGLYSEITSIKSSIAPWMDKIISWHDEGKVSEKEITDALRFVRESYKNSQQDPKFYKSILFRMTSKECLADEKYDKIKKICVLDCQNTQECKIKTREIQKKASRILLDAQSHNKNQTERTSLSFYIPLSIYLVRGDEIKLYESPSIKEIIDELESYLDMQNVQNSTQYSTQLNKTEIKNLQDDMKLFKKLQNDTDKHRLIWDNVIRFIPKTFRINIESFLVGTDNQHGEIASVVRDIHTQNKWGIRFDLSDVYQNDTINESFTKYAIIHEFGHILTESHSQIQIEYGLIENGLVYDSPMERWEKQNRVCDGNFMTPLGCTNKNSYLNRFYQEFWSPIYPEYVRILNIKDDEKFINEIEQFYDANKDKFVSHYALVSPEEDIAESWSAFVLSEKPGSDTIANKKILFFYDYDEFVKLREVIRGRL